VDPHVHDSFKQLMEQTQETQIAPACLALCLTPMMLINAKMDMFNIEPSKGPMSVNRMMEVSCSELEQSIGG
jgi:hypothetical protein